MSFSDPDLLPADARTQRPSGPTDRGNQANPVLWASPDPLPIWSTAGQRTSTDPEDLRPQFRMLVPGRCNERLDHSTRFAPPPAGTSTGDQKKPLAPETLDRIQQGAARHRRRSAESRERWRFAELLDEELRLAALTGGDEPMPPVIIAPNHWDLAVRRSPDTTPRPA